MFCNKRRCEQLLAVATHYISKLTLTLENRRETRRIIGEHCGAQASGASSVCFELGTGGVRRDRSKARGSCKRKVPVQKNVSVCENKMCSHSLSATFSPQNTPSLRGPMRKSGSPTSIPKSLIQWMQKHRNLGSRSFASRTAH